MVARPRRSDHSSPADAGSHGRKAMQVDAISSEDVQTSKAMKRAMSLLAAVAVAAAVGLATVDVPEADLSPHVLKTDAGPGTGAAAPAPMPAPAGGELDPALQRTDQVNDYQG